MSILSYAAWSKTTNKKIKRELKARKMRKCKLKYCFDSYVGILSCVEGSKTTRSQDFWMDSWVENDGFLMYGKTPCKKLTPSSQKLTPSSTSVRPLKLCVYTSTEEKSLWIHWSMCTHINSIPAVILHVTSASHVIATLTKFWTKNIIFLNFFNKK